MVLAVLVLLVLVAVARRNSLRAIMIEKAAKNRLRNHPKKNPAIKRLPPPRQRR
jgi:hypothetical protein